MQTQEQRQEQRRPVLTLGLVLALVVAVLGVVSTRAPRAQAVTPLFATLTNSTLQAQHGKNALAVGLNAVTGGGQVFVTPPSGAGVGTAVAASVYAGTGTNISAQLYLQDHNWGWTQFGTSVTLTAGGWTQLSGTIPSGVVAPINHLGITLNNNTAVASTLFVDNVTVGTLATFDFEDYTVQGWGLGATPSGPANVISAAGTHLVQNGVTKQFDGVNAYELATTWGENYGCGPQVGYPGVDNFFASLRPNSLVRLWVRQGAMAINVTTGQLDWAPLDKVFASAASHGQKLIVSVADYGGGCDDNKTKDDAWYTGGYKSVYNSTGHTPYSFFDYLNLVVSRYATSPAVGLWEPINEPEAWQCTTGYDSNGNCTSALVCNESLGASSLKAFFDAIGPQMRAIDPYHLIESGLVGSGQCGASGADYQTVNSSAGVDVASYHDYGSDTTPMPGDQYNGLQLRFNEMATLGKPLIIGEVGVKAQANLSGCNSLATRNTDITNKMNAQFPAGAAAYLAWDWMPSAGSGCIYESITTGDPLLTTLHNYTLTNN